MSIVKKIGKFLGILILVLIGLLVITLISTTILHKVKHKSNLEFLEEQGFYNPVSVGDHSLNLIEYGGSENGYRIIGLSGNGGGFPLELRELAEELKDEGKVYYLARAGYDGSDDVENEMSVEFVVEDYRKALKNAGIEAPYVLMPHSYAGLLASYWVSKYPDEIEAMVNLDGIVVQQISDEHMQEAADESSGLKIMKTIMNLGIGDVFPGMFAMQYPEFSEDEQRIYNAMNIMTMSSNAFISEIGCAASSINDTYDMIQPNNVPKLYISAENGYQTVEEMKAADVLSEYSINELTKDFEGSEEERIEKAYEINFEEMEKFKKEKMIPYIEKLGNCEIVNLPGSHFIYEEKPQECAEIIKDFLDKIR